MVGGEWLFLNSLQSAQEEKARSKVNEIGNLNTIEKSMKTGGRRSGMRSYRRAEQERSNAWTVKDKSKEIKI